MSLMTRPNKFLDAVELEEWLAADFPQTFNTWRYGEAAEDECLWDWLDREHSSILSEFERCWRDRAEEARRIEALKDEARREECNNNV